MFQKTTFQNERARARALILKCCFLERVVSQLSLEKKSKSKDLILVILKYFEVDWLRWTRNTGDF